MKTDVLAVGQAYLKAWDRRDVSEISKYLHPDVQFLGPMNEVSGKEAVLQSTKRVLPMLQGVKVRSQFASGDQALFTYDFVCAEPINVCRTAELMTFEDGLIRRIELFYDARPFEALARSRQAIVAA
jgi:ketosteroid isomerase-like protein